MLRSVYPGLIRFAAACAGVTVDPDDLVQEAVAKTLERHSLGDLDNAGAYLRTVVLNLARNEYRRAGRQRVASGQASAEDAYPSALAILGALEPRQRAALFLVDVEGYTLAEASALLDCSTSVLRTRLARSRRTVRRAYEREELA